MTIHETYALYKGEKYEISNYPDGGKIELKSDDTNSLKFGFMRHKYHNYYVLTIDVQEIDGCFDVQLYAVYKGERFMVMSVKNDVFSLMIIGKNSLSAEQLGFKQIDRGEWLKHVSCQELDDVFYKFDDLLEKIKTDERIKSEEKQIGQILAAKGLKKSHDFYLGTHDGIFPNNSGFFAKLGQWYIYRNGQNRYETIVGPFHMNTAVGAFAELTGRTEQFSEYVLTEEERRIYNNNVFHTYGEFSDYIEEMEFDSSRCEHI